MRFLALLPSIAEKFSTRCGPADHASARATPLLAARVAAVWHPGFLIIPAPMRILRTSAIFGVWGAAGAAIGVAIGQGLADAAVRVLGDVLLFYHFALTLGAMGAGVAVGLAIAQDAACLVSVASLLRVALVGFCCGTAAGVVALDFYPGVLDARFATFAWTVAGALIGATFAIRNNSHRRGPALGGGMSGGMAAGSWMFDPFADGAAILAEAAGFGCLVAVLIVVADALFNPDSPRSIDGAAP